MTENLNGHCEPILQNGDSEPILQKGDCKPIFLNGDSKPILQNGVCEPILQNGHHVEPSKDPSDNAKPAAVKPPRKKVSFLDNVTDIDGENESLLQNGDDPQQEKEDDPENFSLDEILNVSEKIKFFKTAFADGAQTKDIKPLGHQSSIPEARLAFVTGMVESSLTGSNSRVEEEPADLMQKDEEDTGPKKNDGHVASVELTCDPVVPCPPESDTPLSSNMAATQVTFMKIFAPQKTKNVVESVVDTSSILEHREELRELWEKRMMADDNQSSPSSITAEKTNSKPSTEEGHEEEVVTKTISESETQSELKLTNGCAKAIDSNCVEEDPNANHIQDETIVKAVESPVVDTQKVAEHDNNNIPDSLEEDNVEEYVEEKTYVSELETSLVMKQSAETKVEAVIETPKTEEKEKIEEEKVSDGKVSDEKVPDGKVSDEKVPDGKVSDEKVSDGKVLDEKVQNESVSEETVATSSVEEVDGKEAILTSEPTAAVIVPDEEHTPVAEKGDSVKEIHPSESAVEHIEITTSTTKVEETHHETGAVEPIIDEKPILEIEESNQDGDGFVRLEECLPKVENAEVEGTEGPVEHETVISEQKTALTNGHSEPSVASPTPEPTPEDKTNNSEIEQFVKSGGVKRIIPGVQKTEQPYSTCTTETKIAMEIREMREREEELRLMREQAVLSPSASPVPPKSPSPSPSPKDAPSPTGCGYRVSSVFGHKGSTSPSPPMVLEEEKKQFKGVNKESAVEREIRLARDREEELRKQKGLPPREDDSYVKPSQVKSSQVRVFGKMAGAGSAVKQAATAKIQLEIEEQTQREMALRETGSIQTISHERTDAKVAKLKTPDTAAPPTTNGNSHPVTNGNYMNGRSSPDTATYKRGSPSPTGPRPANIFSQSNGKGNISMHKFITSKGKETTFSAPRNGTPFVPKEENGTRATAPVVKLKRNVSVESKIQQEILEMKQREDELKLLHMNKANGNSHLDDNMEHEMNQKNNLMEYENGHELNEEDISPRHNKLIAQWEQRIQKAES